MEYLGLRRGGYDSVVFRGDIASGEFITFWIGGGKVLAPSTSIHGVSPTPSSPVRSGARPCPAKLANPEAPLVHLNRLTRPTSMLEKEPASSMRGSTMASNSLGTRDRLAVDDTIYQIQSVGPGSRLRRGLPYSLKVLLENLVRNEDGRLVTVEQVGALAAWYSAAAHGREVGVSPVRVLMQDFTGVPCVVDLVAMATRSATWAAIPIASSRLPYRAGDDHAVIADLGRTPSASMPS